MTSMASARSPGWRHRLLAWGDAPVQGVHGFDVRTRLVLLAVFALLVAFRLPGTWAHGRFFGEEGSVFFAYAWYHSASAALFHPFGGYLNLVANGVALLDARLVRGGVVPLEHAPYVTMIAALLVQLLPATLLLTGRADWLTRRWALCASLLFIVISPATEEVFLNSLHSQFHLALCVALVLALDEPRRWPARIGYRTLLFLAPLCGPGSIILLPLFALRSLVDRSRPRFVQFLLLAAGVAAQLLLFFTASPARGQVLGARTLAATLFVRLALLPALGPPLANAIGMAVYRSYSAHDVGWWLASAGAVLCFGTLIVLALRRRRRSAIWLILSALAIAVVSFGGGMIAGDPRDWFGVRSGERYAFLPLVLLALGLVALAEQSDGVRRRFLVALCLVSLSWGVIFYPMPLAMLNEGPDWTAEVAAWHRDHEYRMVSWPTKWAMSLSDRDRPCAPPQRGVMPPVEPSYCESAWLASVALAPPARNGAASSGTSRRIGAGR